MIETGYGKPVQYQTLEEFRQKFFEHSEYSCLTNPFREKLHESDKKDWCEALRSGKYKQGRNKLRSGNTYCCLGVKCEIDNRVNHFYNYGAHAFADAKNNTESATSLPKGFADALGITPDGSFTYHFTFEGVTFCDRTSLIQCNDDAKMTFPQIADVIEYFF